MTSSDTASQIAYLARVLKAPALRESAERLAERARTDGWTHQEYLAACLEAEAATRSAHGAANRIRAAGFPARKTLEDFDFDHQCSVKRDHILHLATLDFITAKTNIVLPGPPEPARPCSPPAWASRPARPGTGCCPPPPPPGPTG